MKNILKSSALAVTLLIPLFAHASTLSGSLGVAAPTINSFTPNGGLPTSTITFNPNTFFVSPGIGDLAGASLSYNPGAFTFTLGTPMSSELLLTLTAGVNSGFTGTAAFGVTYVTMNPANGTYNFYGALTGSSFTTTGADFVFTPLNETPGGGTPITTDGEYSARLFTIDSAPEPSSLVLMATGLFCAAGAVARKRRIAV